jgi:teichuronic acid biosynthesis glycosyltransferase TuaG
MINFNKQLVSIIIPVYNSSKFLRDTLDSVKNQTYEYFEAIIVDDNSIDNSFEIIGEYCKNDHRFKYIKFMENKGAAVARNCALEEAKGRFIAFLDSDDIWEKNKIEKQLEFMKNNNCSFCYTAAKIINENSQCIINRLNVKSSINYKELLKNTMIITSSVIIDRGKIGKFFMVDLRRAQDYATWLKLLRQNNLEALGINEALVQYRVRSKSLSSNKLSSIYQVWYIQRIIENINIFHVIFNVIFFICNSIKKHFSIKLLSLIMRYQEKLK